MNKLQCGIIGVGGYGRTILDHLYQSEQFDIIAIADQDRELAENLSQQFDATPYDDYRSLIVQEKLDALFLTLPTFLCGDSIRLAAKSNMHVFKEAPFARTLPEATEMVKNMDKASRHLHIGAQRRFSPSYQQARDLLAENKLGNIFLIRGELFFNFEGSWDWRGDPVLAGGGVLQEMAYHLVDQIVWAYQAPERVYCMHTNFCAKRVVPPYRTEDTMILNMQFQDGAMANITASCMTGPEKEQLIFHGVNGTLEVSPTHLHLIDPEGNSIEKKCYQDPMDQLINQQIEHFANLIHDPETNAVSLAQDHLVNVAIIESAYLSSRTHSPESLKMYGRLFDIDHKQYTPPSIPEHS